MPLADVEPEEDPPAAVLLHMLPSLSCPVLSQHTVSAVPLVDVEPEEDPPAAALLRILPSLSCTYLSYTVPAVPLVDVEPEEDPPVVVLVHGPRGVGKSTLIRALVKHYTHQSLGEVGLCALG